jgi:hypothetical protein
MEKAKASSIGYRTSDKKLSDSKFHEEIMAGVDDTPLRELSAQRAIKQLGLSREEAEECFNVT